MGKVGNRGRGRGKTKTGRSKQGGGKQLKIAERKARLAELDRPPRKK